MCVYHRPLLGALFLATVKSYESIRIEAFSLHPSRIVQDMPQTFGNERNRLCLISSRSVLQHGERQWNLIQYDTGRRRCGKSCRLRWANHLRPDLKRGAFTEEEEALIVSMHSQIGTKWAKMAAQVGNHIALYFIRPRRNATVCAGFPQVVPVPLQESRTLWSSVRLFDHSFSSKSLFFAESRHRCYHMISYDIIRYHMILCDSILVFVRCGSCLRDTWHPLISGKSYNL